MEVSPLDEYNTLLLSNVHPDGWRNPEPAQCYNLVVMGAGTAGLVSAAADAYNRSRWTPFVQKLLALWLTWTR